MFKIIITILVITLSGCASMDYPIAHDLSKNQITNENSMIIMSTYAEEESVSFASMLAVYEKDGNEMLLLYSIDNWNVKPHFKEGWGFLNVGFLKPGEYRLELYSLNPYFKYKRFEKPITFSVKGNEAIYLGEAYLGSGYLQIRDKRIRDIPMFLERNAEFSEKDINAQLPSILFSKS